MNIEQGIFKAYDIRGIYPAQLNEEGAYAIGRAIATIFLRENPGQKITLAVGGDMRLSTPSLKEKLISSLLESGINVEDVGLVSTPTYYFAVANYGFTGGVQVSASHNPKEYNGFKIVRSGGVAMSGETGIKELYSIIESESYAPLAVEKGILTKREGVVREAIGSYLNEAKNPTLKNFHVVVDVANAMGALDYEALFARVPAKVEKMNFELDGTFPSHEADPLKEVNTKDLQDRVIKTGADFGIAADGDSDRVFIIDEKGHRVPSPVLYTLIAKMELEQHPSTPLAYEIRLGMIVRDEFETKGVKMVPTPVGHSLEKEIMIASGAVFGGEISGHYFFKFPFGVFEAPALLVIKLMELLTKTGKTVSELVEPLNKYFSSGEINTHMDSRQSIEQKIVLVKETYKDGKLILLDGVKVEYETFWFSIRASNTEPVVRLIVEATSKDVMEQKRDELLKLIQD